MNKSVKLVGVGGQGTILATKILCSVLIDAGYDVKMTEIHGMSQRGGSVSSEIRFGDKVFSPVIEKGHADYLVAFEQMEAARYMNYLKQDGLLIVNNYKVHSMITLSGKVPYPEGIIETLQHQIQTIIIDAHTMATSLGNPRVMNIVMLGALVRAMNLEHLDFKQAIVDHVKPHYVDINVKAFEAGLHNTID